ncbi:MAG: virulence protein SciE type [Phycisphaerales bacterium]|nr:MAG: virulence protein SciE type [Phycisphaerales bacterium]
MSAEELIRAGRLDEALSALLNEVRAEPGDAGKRVFLFQLQSVLGSWSKALAQLNVAAELEASKVLLAQIYRPALEAEVFRAEVFAGRRSPMVLGEPPAWLGMLIQAIAHDAAGETSAGAALRDRALEEAEPSPGSITTASPDGDSSSHRFEWLADADPRLGPVFEVMLQGKYYWAPAERVRAIRFEAPESLRDMVWAPAMVTWRNGGEAAALVPVRYAGTEAASDDRLRLSRATAWEEAGGSVRGLGQRELATDAGEFAMLSVRRIEFDANGTDGEAGVG